jgi:lipooligosaccharide transport system permease protein
MTTFVNPTLYLLAMGVGLGSFVNKNGNPAALGHTSYLHFVAPALAATAAATTAASESMFPVMGAIKWQKTYYAMLATPLRVADVMAGHLLWIGARIATAVGSYLIVMAAFGATPSYESIAILPVGVLTGAAFAAPLAAFAATQDSDGGFSLVFRLGVIPLFLFSGVFFPLSQLPVGLRVLAYVTPLWNGVALCRPLAAGHATLVGLAGHLAYLIGVTVAGLVAARYTFRRRLLV